MLVIIINFRSRNTPTIHSRSAPPSVSRSTVCAHTPLATPVFRDVGHFF